MQYGTILNILGTLLMIFSLSAVPPIVVNELYHESVWFPFAASLSITLFTGITLKSLCYKYRRNDLRPRDGFLIVVLFWVVLSVFSALPFLIAANPDVSFTDAFFEAISGITTTGASVLHDIDFMPHSILFYRQELEFLGGMGIIVLALAVLPILGIGGMQLYRAEVPGPMKEEKLTPRLAESAKMLWYIYVGLVLICAFSYWAAGMSTFDAICESFGTISTGGFSPHEASFAFYHSSSINLIGIVFMILGSVSFASHFLVLKQKSLAPYRKDVELKTFLMLLFLVTVVLCVSLYYFVHEATTLHAIISDAFDVVSVMSTTGFVSSKFSTWPRFLPTMMMIIAIVGGCAASTSGGIKVVRFLLMYKQSVREIKRLIHPNAIIPIRMGKRVLPDHIVETIWSFVSVYILLFITLILILMATGINLDTAFGALAASLSNTGASIAGVANGYEGLSDIAKWTLMFAMLAGRLEIFSLLVLFSPAFWRH